MTKERVLFLGMPCPLCGSITSVWSKGLDDEVAQKIQQEFPKWTPAAGACGQCIETYTPIGLI